MSFTQSEKNMASTKLRMNASWDDLTLVITNENNVTSLIRMTNRYDALEVYRQLFVEIFHKNQHELCVTVGAQSYTMQYDVWQSVLGAFDQWYEDYMMEFEFGDLAEN